MATSAHFLACFLASSGCGAARIAKRACSSQKVRSGSAAPCFGTVTAASVLRLAVVVAVLMMPLVATATAGLDHTGWPGLLKRTGQRRRNACAFGHGCHCHPHLAQMTCRAWAKPGAHQQIYSRESRDEGAATAPFVHERPSRLHPVLVDLDHQHRKVMSEALHGLMLGMSGDGNQHNLPVFGTSPEMARRWQRPGGRGSIPAADSRSSAW